MNFDFLKLWPTILLLGANIVDAFSDQITAFLTGHPKVGLVLAGLITLAANATKGIKKDV
jgi:hypothetical protein